MEWRLDILDQGRVYSLKMGNFGVDFTPGEAALILYWVATFLRLSVPGGAYLHLEREVTNELEIVVAPDSRVEIEPDHAGDGLDFILGPCFWTLDRSGCERAYEVLGAAFSSKK